MGKKGPCFHCGIDYTPLWRNGPPHKPVLCNACGSRWRIWGTLDNYMPKHANASMVISHKDTGCQQGKLPLPIEVDDCRTSKDGAEAAGHGYYSAYSKDDGKDESGSGSTIFSTDTCIELESINGNVASGSERPSFCNAQIPKRKRSVLKQRILSPTERLTRQLQGILQEPEFSQLSTEPEDELIFQNNQMSPAEIGLGCVLLKSTAASEEYESDHQRKL